jgi:hypothetical protein
MILLTSCKIGDFEYIYQHNKKDKGPSNDLQNITHKTKDRVTRTPLNTGVNSGAPEG